MSLIEWGEAFITGIDTIDKQHRGLIELLNELSQDFDENKARENLETTLEKLFDYTKYHFSTEEYIMRQANYPDYQKHKDEHDGFVKKVKEFLGNFIDDKEDLTKDIVDFLSEWVKNHILKTDREYIPYLKK